MESTPILIHIGPHKTGTTWLQRRFFPSLKNVVYTDDFALTHKAFLHPAYRDFDAAVARAEFAALMEEARAKGFSFVISDEALGGRAFHQKYYREIVATRLQRTFPSAKILLSARNQDSLLLSMYGEYLRYGYDASLRDFLSQKTRSSNIEPLLDLSFYDFYGALEFYEFLFGEGNVDVVPMEWFLSDTSAFSARISNLLSREIHVGKPVDMMSKERAAWSGWARRVQRIANHVEPRDSRIYRKPHRLSANSIAFKIDRLTPGWARKRSDEADRKLVREAVRDFFDESNRRLAERMGFDLKALGYRV